MPTCKRICWNVHENMYGECDTQISPLKIMSLKVRLYRPHDCKMYWLGKQFVGILFEVKFSFFVELNLTKILLNILNFLQFKSWTEKIHFQENPGNYQEVKYFLQNRNRMGNFILGWFPGLNYDKVHCGLLWWRVIDDCKIFFSLVLIKMFP